jgi:hypothetical protein
LLIQADYIGCLRYCQANRRGICPLFTRFLLTAY